jgi:hypothetical protein
MEEGRELSAVLDGSLGERLLDRVLAAAGDAPTGERVRTAVEALVDMAEANPEETREALQELRANPVALQRLEGHLSMNPRRATLALGAAVQLARAELGATEPNLRNRIPELLRWLEGPLVGADR